MYQINSTQYYVMHVGNDAIIHIYPKLYAVIIQPIAVINCTDDHWYQLKL